MSLRIHPNARTTPRTSGGIQASAQTAAVLALWDGSFTLCESNSIVRYLAMKYAPELMHANSIETFALASRWIDRDNNWLIAGLRTSLLEHVRLRPEQRDLARVERAHDMPGLPNLARWLAALRPRPAWRKWVEPREHHLTG